MPVVAESPPLIFGGTPQPTPSSTRPPTAIPTRTPKPSKTPKPTVPTGTPVPQTSQFVIRHNEFILKIDTVGSCFKREDLSEFTDQEFMDHSQIAMQDKYLIHEQDIYCSMQGVRTLTEGLKRLGEE